METEYAESLVRLSAVVIEILKEFSTQKQPITDASLSEALSARGEVCSIAGFPCLPKLREAFVNLLRELGPISRDEYLQRASELQQRMLECQTMEALLLAGEDLINVTRLLASQAMAEIDHTSDFLAELSKDLAGIEDQLLSYQDHNKNTFLSNDTFCGKLLTHTDGMKDACDSSKSLEDIRNSITSKLATFKAMVESKRKDNQVQLQDSDRRIAELQITLRHQKEEMLQAKRRADALEKEVLVDGLTGIHNRRAYELRIREELKRYHRDGQILSLLLIDVDRFKHVNDLYGHRAGDICLREIAGRMRSSLRNTDFLARYGGEEFAAILAGSSAENTLRIAEKIRVLIERTRFVYKNEEIPVTISIGVTEAQPTDEDPDAMFVRADDAMYQAKRKGRNRVCVNCKTTDFGKAVTANATR